MKLVQTHLKTCNDYGKRIMTPQNYIEPDIEFIRKVGKQSGASFKECMQCGACTVVCNLSSQEKKIRSQIYGLSPCMDRSLHLQAAVK